MFVMDCKSAPAAEDVAQAGLARVDFKSITGVMQISRFARTKKHFPKPKQFANQEICRRFVTDCKSARAAEDVAQAGLALEDSVIV